MTIEKKMPDSKGEIRISKSETNSNARIPNVQNGRRPPAWVASHTRVVAPRLYGRVSHVFVIHAFDFEFVSDFEFRASDL